MSRTPSDRQAKLDSGKRTAVGLARITYEGAAAACSCGWITVHSRDKVREDAIDRHLTKKHNGRGIRL